jgi:hypothetical protein
MYSFITCLFINVSVLMLVASGEIAAVIISLILFYSFFLVYFINVVF